MVSAQVLEGLGRTTARIVRHPSELPAALRVVALEVQMNIGRRPDFVFFEHVGLARMIPWVPRYWRVPSVVFLHGTEVWRRLGRGARAALEGASLLLANSSYTVASARRANPWLGEVRVTHLGIDPAPEPPSLASRPQRVLMVGRMSSAEKYKGHDQVLDAWPTVSARNPGAELCIIGGGDDRSRLEKKSEEHGLKNVSFLGFVTRNRLVEFFREARALLQLSSKEGFGLVALEAVQNGCVVVGLRDTVLDEILPNGVGSVLLESIDGNTLADALARVMAGGSDADRVIEGGLALVRKRYQAEHFRDRVRTALLDIGDPRPS